MPFSVLHAYKVFYPDLFGGVPYVINQLRRVGHQTFSHKILVCSENTNKPEDKASNIERVRSFGTISSLPIAPAYPFKLWLRSRQASIVMLHAPFPLADLVFGLGLAKSCKLIVYWHSDIVRQKILSRLIKPIIRATIARADAVIVSDLALIRNSDILRRHESKCVVAGIPVDPNRFVLNSDQVRAAKQIKNEHPRLVVGCGRLVNYKGFDVLIESAKHVSDAQIFIIGEGPERLSLEKKIIEENVSHKVRLLGAVSDSDLAIFLAAAKIFVMPSRSTAETFGIAQLEAMAAGCPIVNTCIPTAVPNVARHDIEAITIPPNDPLALSNAINSLLDNEGLRARLAEGARIRAMNDYSHASYAQQICSVFHSLAGTVS